MYRVMLEKSATDPANAASYSELIKALALYLSVEQNGAQPADQTHRRLYGRDTLQPGPAEE